MGLFDDILKKPGNQVAPDLTGGSSYSGQSGGQPPQDATPVKPIFIEKSAEETIFGPETESDAINKANAPSPAPTVHAEEDTSSILMDSPSSEPFTLTPEVPMPSMGAPQVTTSETSGSTLAEIHEDQASSLIRMSPTPVVPATPAPVNSSPQSNESSDLFGHIMGNTETSLTSTPDVPVLTPAPTPSPEGAASFSTPREFIEKNIVSIDAMMANIDKRHEAKIGEAEGYKSEKLRFTDLEKNAYSEASLMDREREHALRMRKILETELERDTANRNPSSATQVESTLSEIGTEHAISHKPHHKKSEESVEEEVLSSAS